VLKKRAVAEKAAAEIRQKLMKAGDLWPTAERKLWLDLLEGSFKLIYKDAPLSDDQP
jgi:hypothetical protein